MIYCEVRARLTFGHPNTWYMLKPEYVRGNEKHKILWDLKTQTDPIILARRPSFVLIKEKKNCQLMDFAVPANHWLKNKRKRKQKKLCNMKGMVIPIIVGKLGTVFRDGNWKMGRGMKIIPNRALLRPTKYLEKSWKPEKTCCHSAYINRITS